MQQDLRHLRLLSLFYYVVGGMMLVFASLFLIHLGMGFMIVFAPGTMKGGGSPPPAAVGWLFILFAGAFVLFGWTLAIAMMIAGRFLGQRKHYMFCLIMAGFACLNQPFGAILGIFTIIVLARPSVKKMFETGEVPYDPEEDDEPAPRAADHIIAGSYNSHSTDV